MPLMEPPPPDGACFAGPGGWVSGWAMTRPATRTSDTAAKAARFFNVVLRE